MMEMKMRTHCGGHKLQFDTNTKMLGKLDGDNNTNRNKNKKP
jgi:hypothetical protein